MAFNLKSAAPARSERWEFRIGATVHATDDVLGALRQVIVSPGEQRATGLVVRGALPPREYLIPLEAVHEAAEERIQLLWSIEECRERGRYEEAAFHTPLHALAGYQPGEVAVSVQGGPRGQAAETGTGPRDLPLLRMGLRVVALDGVAGRIRRVLVDTGSGSVTHLVLRQGILAPRDRLVPVDWVSSVTAEVVTLAATRADLAALPEYYPDEELAAKITDAWWGDPVVRAMLAYTSARAVVRDGIATLAGYAWSSVHRRRMEELARGVPGLLDLRNEVVADDELAGAVAHALGSDPRTRGLSIQVHSYLGHVRLEGVVSSPELRAAAAEVAARVPWVKAIINLVDVPGVPGIEPLRVLEPKVGQEVVATDAFLGRVSRVVMSPRTRLVTGIVVEGKLPDPERAEPRIHPDEWPRVERRVVIPASMIEAVGTAVMLRVGALEAARQQEFREEAFVAPDPAWGPPHPYRPEDLLLETHPLPRPIAAMEAERSASVAVSPATPVPGSPLIWIAVARGDRVRFRDGEAGVVDHVVVDPETHLATHLVVRGGSGLPKDTLVPVDWIRQVDAAGIFIDAHREQMVALPMYRPPRTDTEVAATVRAVLEERLGERAVGVIAAAESGVVRLAGRAATQVERSAAVAAAHEVAGVWEVRDELRTDAQVEEQVAVALAQDPRTRGAAAGVLPEARGGRVVLHDLSAAQAASGLSLAEAVPGVERAERGEKTEALSHE